MSDYKGIATAATIYLATGILLNISNSNIAENIGLK